MTEQDLSLNDMFGAIGERKEQVAQGILSEREQKRAEAEKRRRLGRKGDPALDEVDLDEMARKIDDEIERVRREQDRLAAEDAANEDVLEQNKGGMQEMDVLEQDAGEVSMKNAGENDTSFTETAETAETMDVEAIDAVPAEEAKPQTQLPDDSVPTEPKKTETCDHITMEPETVGIGVAKDPKIVITPVAENTNKVYFATSYNGTGLGAICFTYAGEQGRQVITKTYHAENERDACFLGASEMLRALKDAGMQEVLLFSEEETTQLLVRNAIVLADGYSPSNVEFIAVVRDVCAKVCVRFSSASASPLQTLVGLMAKAVTGLI